MLLDDVKQVLRISNNKFDTEITDLIQSASTDLHISGVDGVCAFSPEEDTLIKRAVILYCKANFGLDNVESEKYQKSYDALKIHLALAFEYRDKRGE